MSQEKEKKLQKKVSPEKQIQEDLQNLNKDFNPIRERTLILEYQLLQKYSPVGIYCIPKEGSYMSEWHGVYFCKQGIYADAIIKFRMDFPKSYPKAMPRVVF